MKTHNNLSPQLLSILFILLTLGAIAAGVYFFRTASVPVSPSVTTAIPPPPKTTLPPKVQPPAPTPTTTVVATQLPADELATPTTTVTKFLWQDDGRQTYRYQSHFDLKIDMGGGVPQPGKSPTWQPVNSQLSGILNVRVFDQKHDRVRLGFQLSEAHLSMNGQTFPQLVALFQTFFLVEMSLEGKPLYFHFPRYVDPTNQLFVKEIVNSVQVILATEAAAPLWQTQETQNSGYYQATYQRKATNEIQKRKAHYLNVTLQQTNDKISSFQLTAKIKESEWTARLATQHSWLQKLAGQEKIDFNTPTGKLVEMASQIQLTLSDDPQDPNLGIWQSANDYDEVLLAFANATGDVSLSQNVIKQLELEKLRQQYANTNLNSVVEVIYTKFGQMESISAKEIVPYISVLEDYLTAYPEAALKLPTLLDNLNPGMTLSAYLIGALEHAGTPQAQQALLTIATNTKPEGQKRAIQAITSFHFIAEPQPQVAPTLWQLAAGSDSEQVNTATLAIGSVIKNSTGIQQVEIREELLQRLQDSPEEQQAVLLGAVGNTQDGSLLTNVEPYLNSPHSDIRASAIGALRSFNDPVSLDHIVTAATSDHNQTVRRKALNALKNREDQSQAVSALREHLPQETETELRTDIIQFLGEHKAEDPKVVETLQQQLQQEQNREMRKDLYNAIYR